jgi:cell division protein FtsA
MKKKYGNVAPEIDPKVAENTKIQNGHNISYVDLCHILRVRMEELLKLILLEMPSSDYMTLAPAGLVLTGGCSNVPGLVDLSHATIRMPTRIGEPSGVYGVTDVLSNPAYATGIGLLLWGTRSQNKTWQSRRRAGIFTGVMAMFRKLFK